MKEFAQTKNIYLREIAINITILSLFDSMKVRLAFLFLAIASLSACGKAPSYPIEPHIEFKSVATTNSIIYSSNGTPIYTPDTLTVTFTDGDGDISVYGNPGDSSLCVNPCAFEIGDTSCFKISSKNVFVIDSRDTCVSTYSTANITTDGNYPGLSGEIKILHKIFMKKCFVPAVTCVPETVTFKIRIKDRAGHLSNEVETVPITVEVRNL